MRPTAVRLLASVKPTRFLEPGVATGITGLYTHGSPRSTLLYLYSSTLDKLRAVPEHSLYRQSVEALTKHRMAIVESAVPEGYEAWAERASKLVAEHPEQFNVATPGRMDGAKAFRTEKNGQVFLVRHLPKEEDIRVQEWNGEVDNEQVLEGPRSVEEKAEQTRKSAEGKDLEDVQQVEWEPEPQLTADQVEEVENKIGAGLIEEVIQVAEGELRLVDTMVEAKIWENLEEKPVEGQWVYFERKSA